MSVTRSRRLPKHYVCGGYAGATGGGYRNTMYAEATPGPTLDSSLVASGPTLDSSLPLPLRAHLRSVEQVCANFAVKCASPSTVTLG
jgi:hypothetical protein